MCAAPIGAYSFLAARRQKSTVTTFSFVKTTHHTSFDYAYITIHGQPGENGPMQGYFDLIRPVSHGRRVRGPRP